MVEWSHVYLSFTDCYIAMDNKEISEVTYKAMLMSLMMNGHTYICHLQIAI